jgi:hypothetical protein
MADKVFVRFVPKNRQAVSRMATFTATLAPSAAQAFAPDPKRALQAQVELANRNVSALKTPEKPAGGIDAPPAIPGHVRHRR